MAVSGPRSTLSTAPSFTDLGVPAVLVDILAKGSITVPSPIQAATLPDSMAGRDVLGRAQTGSGKTYAFLLPVLAVLAESAKPRQAGRPRALILAPTRELVTQIDRALAPLAAPLGLKHTTVFGGVSAQTQIRALTGGIDILVACAGRLEDLIRGRNADLRNVEITVLDEADHMADLGFLPAVQRLLEQTPRTGQRLLFSATLDRGVDGLVRRFLNDPITHSVDAEDAAAPVQADHHVLHVSHADRMGVLVDLLAAPGRTIVFTRTKHRAKRLTRDLNASGVPAVEMHGNLAQNARERNLAAFSDGTATTLVATDIAARGIHVDDVALVVHADPPVEHKSYLHRSGRTARAGAAGTVITLMTDDQVADVRDLVRKASIKPTTTRVGAGHPLLAKLAPGERTFRKITIVETPDARPQGRARGASGGARAGQSRGGASGAARGSSRGGTSFAAGRGGTPTRSRGGSHVNRVGADGGPAGGSAGGSPAGSQRRPAANGRRRQRPGASTPSAGRV